MSSAAHSPRRIRSAPSIALYELRLLRTSSRPGSLVRALEPRIRRWRGLARWHIHAFSSSARGEIVLQLVAERQSHVARVDNLFVSWRKTLQRIFKLGALKRGVWSSDALVDVKLMHEQSFDAAVAKLLAEADAVSSDVARWSYLEPALPSQSSQSQSSMPLRPPIQPQLAPPPVASRQHARPPPPPPTQNQPAALLSGARVASTTQTARASAFSGSEAPRADTSRADAPRIVSLS
jgi:hypothetical protein